jgi:gamma-glutamyltranspeptidase/glutathione hydrolase
MLPFVNLIQPAIDLAEKGFPITQRQANEMNELSESFKKNNPKNSYLIREGEWKTGDSLIQKDLAHTLELIRERGRDGF